MKTSAKIVPTRIKEARESRGLSMTELSDLIGVTSQAISQYEKGITVPSIFVLKKMKEVLGFPIEFFYKPKEILRCSNSAVYFRSMVSTSKKLKNAYAYRVEWANEIYSYLKQYINFNEPNLPDLEYYISDETLDFETIELIAKKVREYWKLGLQPIDDIIEVVEDNGIIVSKIRFNNKKIDAFSQWYDGVPYIFLGNSGSSSVRMRFDIAHELGHLLLHPFITGDQVFEKKVLEKIEAEANYFAGALLMPAESVAKEMIHSSLDYLCILKEKWKISIGALIMRGKQLEILSDNQVSYLYRQLSAKNMRMREPLDDIIPTEEPKLLVQALELLIENDIISAKHFLIDTCLNQEDVQDICSLSDEFFEDNECKKEKERMILKVIK